VNRDLLVSEGVEEARSSPLAQHWPKQIVAMMVVQWKRNGASTYQGNEQEAKKVNCV